MAQKKRKSQFFECRRSYGVWTQVPNNRQPTAEKTVKSISIIDRDILNTTRVGGPDKNKLIKWTLLN